MVKQKTGYVDIASEMLTAFLRCLQGDDEPRMFTVRDGLPVDAEFDHFEEIDTHTIRLWFKSELCEDGQAFDPVCWRYREQADRLKPQRFKYLMGDHVIAPWFYGTVYAANHYVHKKKWVVTFSTGATDVACYPTDDPVATCAEKLEGMRQFIWLDNDYGFRNPAENGETKVEPKH